MVVALFTVVVAGPITTHAQRRSTQEIERVVTDFLTAFGNRDFAQFLPFFSEDATMFFPPSAPAPTGLVRGRNEDRADSQGDLCKVPITHFGPGHSIRPLDLLVEEFGDAAVVTFHLGSEAARQRRTIVMRRVGEQWRIAHLHGSASATP